MLKLNPTNWTDELRALVSKTIGPIAKPDRIQSGEWFTQNNEAVKLCVESYANLLQVKYDQLGDVSTLLNPEIIEEIKRNS